MKLFKRNPFGHILFIKVWLIRILGVLSHSRFRGFNELQIEGSDVLEIYQIKYYLFPIIKLILQMFAMFHVFNASLSGRENTIKNVGYIWKPKLNMYYIAAKETMQDGLLPKILAYGVREY